MSKRIFVGIPIKRKLQKEIQQWIKDNLAGLKIRVIPAENLHLTLIPPWNEKNIGEVISKFAKIKRKLSSFEISFNKVTFGPSKAYPRLIWAEGQTSKDLDILKKSIENELEKGSTNRPFKPHLTLARFKRKDYLKFPIRQLEKDIDWRVDVETVCLYQSTLLPRGAQYKILKVVRI